jgi:cytochrome bd-type quinol oxidase subunit 2
MGVVSGIVMSYQFGTNWSRWSKVTGYVLGPLIQYEVVTAFFLEAAFLGILLFGRRRVPKGMHFFAAAMVALVTAFIVYRFWRAVTDRREVQPFVWSMALFLVSYLGLAISLWPQIMPPSITLWEAASPPESQVFLLVGMMFLIPTIIAYTVYNYWVFRGKITGDTGYH